MAKAGRPKADVTKEKVDIEKEFERLKEYADSSKMTVTQVVQKGVERILEEKH